MKITVTAIGSRGDVQPMLAIANRFQRSGHKVRVATHMQFEKTVHELGCEFRLIQSNPMEILAQLAAKGTLEVGFFRAFIEVMKLFAPLLKTLGDDILAACEGYDVAIVGLIGTAYISTLVDVLNIRVIPLLLQPIHATGAFANPFITVPQALRRVRVINRVSWRATDNPFADSMLTRPINAWRKARYKLPPTGAALSAIKALQLPTLYGFSPRVIAKPADWGERLHVTGYWFLNSDPTWDPPSPLLEFLKAGSPPIYIGFGSMMTRNAEQSTRLIMDALRHTRQRAILSKGWGGLALTELSDNVFVVEDVPHAWLFPRMAAVVHHGGAGTTAAGLRAGVPSIVTPFSGDQVFWGQRVAALGVGPDPLPHHKMTTDKLAQAIDQVMSDQSMRHESAQLGEAIRSEDGVGRATELIQSYLH